MIEKVQVISRKLLTDERGWFFKAITGKEENLPMHTGEVYLTMGKPGTRKGGHYHVRASEWFTVIQGSARLRLEDTVTKETREFELSLEKAVSVFVPCGVAHVFENTGTTDFIVLAYTDVLYDPSDTIAYSFE